jgi:hypothetical protein
MAFFHLEIRDAITQQTTQSVILFKQGHCVPGARELLCGCQTCRARTHHRHFFTGLNRRQLGFDPTMLPSAVNDGMLDGLDAHRQLVHIERARSLTRRRTNAPREFREIVGAVQHINRVFPITLVDQLIEIRDDVVDWTAAVTKRRTAVHAPCGLLVSLLIVQSNHELAVTLQALGNWLIPFLDAL